jgi:outer membrane protein assembly factor BamB
VNRKLLPLLTVWLAAGALVAPAAEWTADALTAELGVPRGIVVLLGDKECRVARQVAAGNKWLVYVQLADAADVAAACRAADAAGGYGTSIFVERGTPRHIGLASNAADAVVVRDGLAEVNRAEVQRVLRPGGKAFVGKEKWDKPFPAGIDDWSHHYHGPDNNPQSLDRLARAPYLTQFIVEPRYAPAPQAAVASHGRVFMAFGNIAWHEREEAWMNTLLAINGFNGTTLWQRPLTPGIMVDRNTLVATPTTLYLADNKSCKLLDAATGQVRDEIAFPAEETGGAFWKWIALEGGVLYGLLGAAEPLDNDARWRRTAHGWPWNEMSKLYNDPQHLWGFGTTLIAVDAATKRLLWKHREDPPIDSRALCLKNDRFFLWNYGRYLKCLHAKDGRLAWQRTPDKDPDVFEAVGKQRPEQGPIQGWKTNMYLKCTDKALYFSGPQVPWLTALSAEDGRLLWKYVARDLHILIREDGLYTIGPATSVAETKKLDPLTGAVLGTYQTRRRSCTRPTGSVDCIFFRGHEGTGRLEPASGLMAWMSTMRPSCQVGVLVAGGHLYWVPWACDCNLQMFGAMACAPAGDFRFDQPATERERLESLAVAPAPRAAFAQQPTDWPTYRADNARSAKTAVAMPERVKQLWQFQPTAPTEPTAPVAAGGLVFVGGADGIVRALAAADGKVRWTAYTGGAVRYPPAIAQGRALVGSGDGWVYAFDATTGGVAWRFRAAPSERKISFYGSLISTWPVASGVLVEKGVAYFAAGITDSDGTHVYALDAERGTIRWQNHTAGHLDPVTPRGVACQGDTLVHDGRLYLAGGNSVSPGMFDLATGQCLNVAPTSMGGTAPRGRELLVKDGKVQVVGQPLYSRPDAPVYDAPTKWDVPQVVAANARLSCVERPPKSGQWALVARNVSGDSDLWSQPLPAVPVRWGLAVDCAGRIAVTLVDGRVLCFGKG